jgi:hypothetical protein
MQKSLVTIYLISNPSNQIMANKKDARLKECYNPLFKNTFIFSVNVTHNTTTDHDMIERCCTLRMSA